MEIIATVVTIAGNGNIGYRDGPGQSSQFNFPTGIAIHPDGSIIVCDSKNSRIRKIHPNNYNVTTIAGSKDPGFHDGPALEAQFNDPDSITVDKMGNIYVCDGENKRIRKIDTRNIVTTFSGNGESDFKDGDSKNAAFKEPCWVAADENGSVFVSDTNRIRQISAKDGSVITFAGNDQGYNDGPIQSSEFFRPTGIVVNQGKIFVCDSFNNRIRKIENGIVSTIAGNGNHGFKDGHSTSSMFCGPYGITIDPHGNIFVADTLNHRIRLIDVEGNTITIAGDGTEGYNDGQSTATKFNCPIGIAADKDGNIFVADVYNHRIRKITVKSVPIVLQSLENLLKNLVQLKKITQQDYTTFLSSIGNLTLQDLQNITDNMLEKLLFNIKNINSIELIPKIHIFLAIKESKVKNKT